MDYPQHRDVGSLGAQIGIAQSSKDGRQCIKALTEIQPHYTLGGRLLGDANSACLFAAFAFWRAVSAFSNRLECEAMPRNSASVDDPALARQHAKTTTTTSGRAHSACNQSLADHHPCHDDCLLRPVSRQPSITHAGRSHQRHHGSTGDC